MKKNLLAVSFDEERGIYSVDIPQGSTVNETAFCMSVIIKCFLRDGYIEKPSDVLDLVSKYNDDPQFKEVEAN